MSFAPGATLHDLLRYMIRSYHWADEATQRQALGIVDGNEAGYNNLGEWEVELAARAATAHRRANPDAPETDAERAARLEAENEQLRATVNAHAGGRQPSSASAPSGGSAPANPTAQPV